MTQFDINPYHWPGWAVSCVAFLAGVPTAIFFHESCSNSHRQPLKSQCVCAKEAELGSKFKSSLTSFVVAKYYTSYTAYFL